jgi:two-component system, OmpR family, torCAD operon response regulator TorR
MIMIEEEEGGDRHMLHILLVAEYPPLRRVLAMTLERTGYRVTQAFSANNAQQLLAQQAFDLLVCDLDTVSGRSDQLLSVLHAVPQGTPIVALGSPEDLQQDTSTTLDLRLALAKPVRRKALLAGIRCAQKAYASRST